MGYHIYVFSFTAMLANMTPVWVWFGLVPAAPPSAFTWPSRVSNIPRKVLRFAINLLTLTYPYACSTPSVLNSPVLIANSIVTFTAATSGLHVAGSLSTTPSGAASLPYICVIERTVNI